MYRFEEAFWDARQEEQKSNGTVVTIPQNVPTSKTEVVAGKVNSREEQVPTRSTKFTPKILVHPNSVKLSNSMPRKASVPISKVVEMPTEECKMLLETPDFSNRVELLLKYTRN